MICARIEDSVPDVCVEVAEAAVTVAETGDTETLATLAKLSRDDCDEHVREVAERAIERL